MLLARIFFQHLETHLLVRCARGGTFHTTFVSDGLLSSQRATTHCPVKLYLQNTWFAGCSADSAVPIDTHDFLSTVVLRLSDLHTNRLARPSEMEMLLRCPL